jgi:hypothetical protein
MSAAARSRQTTSDFGLRPKLTNQGRFGSLPYVGRKARLLTIIAITSLAGCSVHPTIDDISPIPTQEIVRSARCEMRLGLFDQVKRLLENAGITNFDVSASRTT